LRVSTFSGNWFYFSMFSAFVGEKSLLRPFVFKMFSAFGTLPPEGQEVALYLVRGEARKKCIINSFLLRVRVVVQSDIEAALRRHLVRQVTDKLAATTLNGTTADVLPMPITASASPE